MRNIVTCTVLALSTVSAVPAQEALEHHPGYFHLENLDVFAPDRIEVDVDMRESMVKVAAAAVSEQDPGFADLLDSVRRIRVRVGAAAAPDPSAVRALVDRTVAELEGSGWVQMTTVKKDDEVVYVLSKTTPDLILGLLVLVHAGDQELVLANIAGDMDPVLIGRIISKFETLGDFDFSLDGG